MIEYLESPNDQLLWSPSLDENQEENSALVNKYLKLAAKECTIVHEISNINVNHAFLF